MPPEKNPKERDEKKKQEELFLRRERIYAEYNSSELDLISMRKLLDACDVLRIRNTMRDIRVIRPYYSLLNTLYFSFLRNWISAAERENCDKIVRDIEKAVFAGRNSIDPKVFTMLNDLHAFLIKARQFQGLGISFRRDESLARRLARGLNIKDRSGKK